jgi:anhydro-N-acetylmuramic acid kinase
VRALGLMSGTSLDGISAALVELTPRERGYFIEIERFQTVPFEARFRARLLDEIVAPNAPTPAQLAKIDRELGLRYAETALSIAREPRLDFVASHGLTIFHDGLAHRTLQLGDPYLVRDALEATVIFDFRRADCAAGGEGAPLVPYVDALLFASPKVDTICLNLGGIANLTIVPRDAQPEQVTAWDCGPGNMLLDAFVRTRTRGREQCDKGGSHAIAGHVDRAVLTRFLRDSYLAKPPPKSTGRERFGAVFLTRYARSLAKLSLEDGCATLAALTVEAIARDIERWGPAQARVIVSGGGVRNKSLLAGIALRLGRRFTVRPSDDLGIDPDAKEALAFAILGYETLRGRAAGLPTVTGAERAAVLGAIAPFGLRDLLAKLERELSEPNETSA